MYIYMWEFLLEKRNIFQNKKINSKIKPIDFAPGPDFAMILGFLARLRPMIMYHAFSHNSWI